jgi:hypothetical protein
MNELVDNLLKPVKNDTKKNTPTSSCQLTAKNQVHQIDILYLPHDNGYKYALVVVDLYSGLTEAEKLKTRTAQEVIKALTKIYSRDVLDVPLKLEADQGSEFKGNFNGFVKNNKIVLKRGKTNRHRQQSVVERRNRMIAEKIFRRQTAQELLTGEASTQWTEDLHIYIKLINKNLKKTKCNPLDTKWEPRCEGDACNLLNEGTKVRAKLEYPINPATGKRLMENGGRFRATDIRWDPEIRTIEKIILNPNQPPMYILNDNGKDAEIGYTKNQLQVISDNEKNPSKSVLRGKYKNPKNQKFVIEPSGEGIGNLQFVPDNVKQWLEKYGNSKINGLYVGKIPIRKIWSDMLKILSKGKLEQIMKELKYDHLYHTFILYHLKDDNSTWMIERNGRLSVKAYNPMVKHEEFKGEARFLPIITTNKTVSEMFENHEKLIGGWDKLIWYDPVLNNCQKFINNHLRANGLLTNEIEKFVNQKLKTVMKDYTITRQFLKHVISLGIIIENYFNF